MRPHRLEGEGVSTKEEIAAKIRKHLRVDVEFEKLNKNELEKLLKYLEEEHVPQTSKKQDEQEVQEQQAPTQTPTLFPLGIVPAVVDTLRSRVPKIREAVQKAVDTALDEAVSRATVSEGGEREKKKG
jgi:sirohydrochlorin ferrochelatase